MTSRFAQAQGGMVQAVDTVADVANAATTWNDSAVATTSFTLTTTQIINGDVRLSGQAAITVTTPTAAAIVAAIPNVQVGTAFDFVLVNTNSGTATMAAGTGVTLVGTTTAATVTSRKYKGVVTNATSGTEAVSLIGLMTGSN